VTSEERTALIDRYRTGYAAVAQAVADAGPDRLDTANDGGWTVRQVVHHLADGELRSAVRLATLLAEDEPVIEGYDQDAYAAALRYDHRPVDPALRAVEAARAATQDLLDRLTERDWARRGTHTESGAYGVEDWLRIYAAHPHDHAAQIRRAAGLPA
jgi:hypothetical protein